MNNSNELIEMNNINYFKSVIEKEYYVTMHESELKLY